MLALSIVLLFIAPAPSHAEIYGNANCSIYNGTTKVYLPSSTMCENIYPDEVCDQFYKPDVSGPPTPGTDNVRPPKCYTGDGAVEAAVGSCPKSCGYCCMTKKFTCTNPAIYIMPATFCYEITAAQCADPTWHDYIKASCPASCGFCDVPPPQNIPDPCVYQPDMLAACPEWVAKGFCTSEFYTLAQKKQYCSTSCNIC